jgi:hypothetical protein
MPPASMLNCPTAQVWVTINMWEDLPFLIHEVILQNPNITKPNGVYCGAEIEAR